MALVESRPTAKLPTDTVMDILTSAIPTPLPHQTRRAETLDHGASPELNLSLRFQVC